MSFRRRNIVVAGGSVEAKEKAQVPGVRPSPLDGRLTTSTSTRSLDSLLAGHSGLVLGTSLLIEETGTTDFGGALLRYYASEGIVQGHHVHVLGMNEAWGRELPGLAADGSASRPEENRASDEKMKIAWRYERLGEFGVGARDRPQSAATSSTTQNQAIFSHDFDLSKRLILPSSAQLKFIPIPTNQTLDFKPPDTGTSPFTPFLHHLTTQLSSAPTTIHRIIIPSLLSPAFYPPHAANPDHVLQFLHALRALLRLHPSTLSAMLSLPLSLYPRSSGLTRWMELLSDGVLELAPFPSSAIAARPGPGASSSTKAQEEDPPQGLLRIHALPVFHEKGGGGASGFGGADDLAFTLSRRKGLVIRPYSLPPVEGDAGAQEGGLEHEHGKATKVDIEF